MESFIRALLATSTKPTSYLARYTGVRQHLLLRVLASQHLDRVDSLLRATFSPSTAQLAIAPRYTVPTVRVGRRRPALSNH